VHFSPNAVPDKFAHDGKIISPGFIFYFRANIAEAPARASHGDRACERGFGDSHQTFNAFINYSDGDSCGVVPHPAVFDDADVELNDIAVLNTSLAPDAVDNFIVQRDANVAGENAVPKPVTEECAFDIRFLHEISSRLIHFFGRDSGPDEFAHAIKNFPRATARLPHPFHFLGILDGDHAVALFSIKREMSLKTASRPRFPSIRRKIDIFS
jgi:hypothetical protein